MHDHPKKLNFRYQDMFGSTVLIFCHVFMQFTRVIFIFNMGSILHEYKISFTNFNEGGISGHVKWQNILLSDEMVEE